MHTKETVISTEGEEVIGNSSNRFDAQRQSTTFGPEPPTADDGPPESRGSFAPSPKAS